MSETPRTDEHFGLTPADAVEAHKAFAMTLELALAAALEENARLRAELGKFSDRNGYALRQRADSAEAELAVARDELEVVRHCHRKVCDRMNNAEAELAKLRQKLMRYEHAEAADILHPPQDEQARADFPEEK